MNEPIISPWIFYWLEIINNLDKINNFLFLVLLIFNFVLLGLYIMARLRDSNSYRHDDDKEFARKVKIILRKTLPLLIAMLIGVVFIPSKETMYKMLISNYVTKNNINIAKQNMYDVVEQISDIVIKKVSKEK